MIFFINTLKVQIKLDFCNLEVVVNFIDAQGKEDLIKIRNYLFYSIISLYWDHDTLDFAHYSDYLDHKLEKGEVDIDDPLCNQLINYDNLYKNSFCRPTDLFVSIDGIHFINYMKFWDDSIKETVVCSIKDENGKLSSQTTIESEPYKYLFKNKYNDFNTEKVFKIAISYAKEDHSTLIYGYDPIQELYDNLNILKRDFNLDIFIDWDIDENNWGRQIREKFNEADLIIVMNSNNYNKLDKKYIWEVEMPIINSKFDDKVLSILRINVLDCITSKAVNKLNDFKKGVIPTEYTIRVGYFKNLVKDLVKPKLLEYAK